MPHASTPRKLEDEVPAPEIGPALLRGMADLNVEPSH